MLRGSGQVRGLTSRLRRLMGRGQLAQSRHGIHDQRIPKAKRTVFYAIVHQESLLDLAECSSNAIATRYSQQDRRLLIVRPDRLKIVDQPDTPGMPSLCVVTSAPRNHGILLSLELQDLEHSNGNRAVRNLPRSISEGANLHIHHRTAGFVYQFEPVAILTFGPVTLKPRYLGGDSKLRTHPQE